MLKRTLGLSLALTLTLLVGLPYAREAGFGAREGGMLLEGAKEIGLKEAQIDKIKSIRLNAEKQIIKLRAEVRIAQLELREMMSSENPEKSRVNRKIDEISGLRASIRKIEAGARIDVMSTLSAEQMERLQEYRMKKMKEHRCGHRCCQLREPGPRPGVGKMEGWGGRHLDPPPPPCVPEPIKEIE